MGRIKINSGEVRIEAQRYNISTIEARERIWHTKFREAVKSADTLEELKELILVWHEREFAEYVKGE